MGEGWSRCFIYFVQDCTSFNSTFARYRHLTTSTRIPFVFSSLFSKMSRILRYDWLPERARWSYLARAGLPAVSRKRIFPEGHIINPLLTKFVQSRWLGIGLVLFCEFMDLDCVSVHKHAKKKELGQYPAILTSHLVNNPYIVAN